MASRRQWRRKRTVGAVETDGGGWFRFVRGELTGRRCEEWKSYWRTFE